jgi:hypothetical protein
MRFLYSLFRKKKEVRLEGSNPTPKDVQFQIKANEKVLIGLPADPPSSAIEQLLRSKASSFPSIAELYVFQMATKAGSSHTVIGIDLSEDVVRNQQDEIARTLGVSVQSELKPGSRWISCSFVDRCAIRLGCSALWSSGGSEQSATGLCPAESRGRLSPHKPRLRRLRVVAI